MTEPKKKNLWLTIILSGVAAILVWQQLARSSRSGITNAKQSGRVVILYGEASPSPLASAIEKELGSPIRDLTRPDETSKSALARVDEALSLKPNCVLLRLGQSDLSQKIPLDETLRAIELLIARIHAQGAFVAFIAEAPPTGVGDNWLMALHDMARANKVLWVPVASGVSTARITASTLAPFF